jgi:hypothetical protein
VLIKAKLVDLIMIMNMIVMVSCDDDGVGDDA